MAILNGDIAEPPQPFQKGLTVNVDKRIVEAMRSQPQGVFHLLLPLGSKLDRGQLSKPAGDVLQLAFERFAFGCSPFAVRIRMVDQSRIFCAGLPFLEQFCDHTAKEFEVRVASDFDALEFLVIVKYAQVQAHRPLHPFNTHQLRMFLLESSQSRMQLEDDGTRITNFRPDCEARNASSRI